MPKQPKYDIPNQINDYISESRNKSQSIDEQLCEELKTSNYVQPSARSGLQQPLNMYS